MKNYIITKNIIGSRKSKTIEYSYSICKDGKHLHRGAALESFTSRKKAEEFANNFNESTALEKGFRWF